MAGSIQTTVTAPTGPAELVTALVTTGARSVTLFSNGVLQIMDAIGHPLNFDLHVTTTITATASSGVFTFTISQ